MPGTDGTARAERPSYREKREGEEARHAQAHRRREAAATAQEAHRRRNAEAIGRHFAPFRRTGRERFGIPKKAR